MQQVPCAGSYNGACVPAQVVAAFKILTSDPQVKAILVNIFGASIVMRIGMLARTRGVWAKCCNTSDAAHMNLIGLACTSVSCNLLTGAGKRHCNPAAQVVHT